MQKLKCHLCLVSGQPTPNLTPLLDSAMKPEEVILLVSPDMCRQAEWLRQAIAPAGIRVHQWFIENAWDIEHIRDRVMGLLQEYGDESMALNATGGTKPMSIAAFEVFRDLDLPVFYVHPEKDRVIWLHPKEMPAYDIEERIRLPQFLLAHGVVSERPNRTVVPHLLRELTKTLVRDMHRFADALGTMNYLAFQARNKTLSVMIPEDKRQWGALLELFDLFAVAGLLAREGEQIRFKDDKARFFVNGGWLEHHLFALLHKIRAANPHIHDLAQGLNVTRGDVKNELDIAFLADNTLYLIECKTAQFRQGGAEAIYKLDALTDAVGGIRARSMLVSFQSLSKADRDRAAQAGIQLCIGRDIQQLEQIILNWTQ